MQELIIFLPPHTATLVAAIGLPLFMDPPPGIIMSVSSMQSLKSNSKQS